MKTDFERDLGQEEYDETVCLDYDFGLSRRGFVQVLGAGLLITVGSSTALAQRSGRGGGGGRPRNVTGRIHIGKDGTITVLTGKVEMGQGSRAELTQAAAEELRVAPEKVTMLMGDTSQVPDDGTTAGSQTTPRTVPVVRQAAAAARELLLEMAAQKWTVDRSSLEVRDGKITHAGSNRSMTYADLAQAADLTEEFQKAVPADVKVTPVKEWKVLGTSFLKPNRRDLATGAHRFPSDIVRPGMLYGKVLRASSYGAKLTSIDLGPAKAMKDVVVVHDGDFVGVAAPNTFLANQALQAIAKTAKWEPAPHPASKDVFAYLKQRANGDTKNPFVEELAQAKKTLKQTYHTAYIQHAPMETRVAVAEWKDGKLTVWTGTQAPFGYHSELVRTFRLANDAVRVIVPDFGGGFGGKHSGEAAVEAARLARAAERPVIVKWTREEEFTWAYFRPAAVIEAEAGLDEKGKITSWHYININSGGAALDTPYKIAKSRSRFVGSNSPLRQGSYRALASTANNFARESFMDELAAAAGADPLEFRLAHLENQRLRTVLETAAKRFGWAERKKRTGTNIGIGLACGTEKNSVVAACVEIDVNTAEKTFRVRHVCEVFECGKVLNPKNMVAQVQGCILMGLGAALREEMRFEDGKMLNPFFRKYLVPRVEDVPELDIQLLDRPDMDAIGGGETPIIAVAPAIANALFQATGVRVRQMPIRLPGAKEV